MGIGKSKLKKEMDIAENAHNVEIINKNRQIMEHKQTIEKISKELKSLKQKNELNLFLKECKRYENIMDEFISLNKIICEQLDEWEDKLKREDK